MLTKKLWYYTVENDFIPQLKTTFLASTAKTRLLCRSGVKKEKKSESENRVAASCFARDVTAGPAARQLFLPFEMSKI